MTISGFTFVRNGAKLYYPVRESIESILPIVDEFVIALGEGDPDDQTESEIAKIKSGKIRIIRTKWDLAAYPGGTEYAHQTDIAKEACRGDWMFYIQCDEVVHEKYLPIIKDRCKRLLSDRSVEGLLFGFRHFWGDYDHYLVSHAWYPKEIRIVRNDPGIHSWRDAQSFRVIPDFDGKDYFRKSGTRKLRTAAAHACVFHYGWVRPPDYMQRKRIEFSVAKRGEAETIKTLENVGSTEFDYGDLSKLHVYSGTHPRVMKDWIARFDWADRLYPARQPDPSFRHKHEKAKYRILTFVEQKLLNGRMIGGFRNYRFLNR